MRVEAKFGLKLLRQPMEAQGAGLRGKELTGGEREELFLALLMGEQMKKSGEEERGRGGKQH